MAESDALALARMRALGQVPRPSSPQALSSWSEQAEWAGRRLVEISGPGYPPVVALGWLDGSEPAAGAETGVERTKPPPVLVLTFAAALRACWPDQSEHPFPGAATDADTVLAAVAALGPITGSATDGGAAGRRHHEGALRRLAEARLLVIDGSVIRLGSAVALWSAGQVMALRAIYGQLPGGETE